jgi:hypothetical protein
MLHYALNPWLNGVRVGTTNGIVYLRLKQGGAIAGAGLKQKSRHRKSGSHEEGRGMGLRMSLVDQDPPENAKMRMKPCVCVPLIATMNFE